MIIFIIDLSFDDFMDIECEKNTEPIFPEPTMTSLSAFLNIKAFYSH